MLKSEKIKRELDSLPEDMLWEIEKFIKILKVTGKTSRKKSSLLYQLANLAIEIDIPKDFSRQHDHYLYGLPKK